MVVLMDLKLTALLRHRPLLTQEAMRMQTITVMVRVAAQIVVQTAAAAIVVAVVVIIAEEDKVQSPRIMTAAAAIVVVVKTRMDNVSRSKYKSSSQNILSP
jgi:hypothetical protein